MNKELRIHEVVVKITRNEKLLKTATGFVRAVNSLEAANACLDFLRKKLKNHDVEIKIIKNTPMECDFVINASKFQKQ